MRDDYKSKCIERKQTQGNACIIYQINQDIRYLKVDTIKRLVRRAKIVSSTEESLTGELDYIKKTMRLNGNPQKLINTKTFYTI